MKRRIISMILMLPLFVTAILAQPSFKPVIADKEGNTNIGPNQIMIPELVSYNASGYSSELSLQKNLPPVVIGDGNISEIWESVTTYTVEPFGDTGKIASVHLAGWIYFYVEFQVDLNWIAIQLDSDNSSDPENFDPSTMEPMADGDDMWVFGTAPTTSALGDCRARGQAPPFVESDDQNDLFWELIEITDDGGTVTSLALELGRAWSTGDVAGFDATFTPNYNISMYFASDAHHRPSSSISYAKLALSSLAVGGNNTETPTNNAGSDDSNLIKASTYLFYNVGLAMFAGAVVYAVVMILSTLKVKKET